MPLDQLEVRVSIQKVLFGLILVIVPLSVVGLYLTSQSDKALDQSAGNYLKTVAQMQSNEIVHSLNDRVSSVRLIAAEPNVIRAVSAGTQNSSGKAEALAADKTDKLEKAWNAPESAPAVKALLSSEVSETLRHYRDMDPRILSLVVTDARGVTVAATSKPAHYTHTDDDAWQSAYAAGQGALNVSNILYNESKKAYFVDIGVPITERATGQLAGVAIASVDVSPMLLSFQQDNLTNGVRTTLVSDDGSVISGFRTDVFKRIRSEEFAAIGDSLGSLQGRQTGFVTADLNAGRQIIGFSDTGLKKDYKNIGWTVIASQSKKDAEAPLHQVAQFAMLMVVLGMLMVTLLAVYYALHRKQYEDIEHSLPMHQPATL